MGRLADYVFYNSGNECPTSYHIWSFLSTFSAVLSRRVWIDHGYFKIFPNLYVCLVGDAGSGKNTANHIATKRLLIDNFPDVPICASVTSREDICKFMGSEECLRSFRLPDDSIQEYRPFHFSVNELANLLSVDFRKMVDFLVDLYDSEFFSTSFKHDTTKDKIPFPCATMLSCAVPDWFMRSLKMDLFSGGFGRRLNIVYENKTILNAHPTIPENGQAAWDRIVEHFKAARELSGEMKMSPDCVKWWDKWYEDPTRLLSDDPIIKQTLSTKHVMVQKLAMLSALDNMPFRMTLEAEDFKKAVALVEVNESPLRKLSAGVGRNELAAVSLAFIDFIRMNGGREDASKMQRVFFRDCKPGSNEYRAMVDHLLQTEQIYSEVLQSNGKTALLYFTPEGYEAHRKWKEGQK